MQTRKEKKSQTQNKGELLIIFLPEKQNIRFTNC